MSFIDFRTKLGDFWNSLIVYNSDHADTYLEVSKMASISNNHKHVQLSTHINYEGISDVNFLCETVMNKYLTIWLEADNHGCLCCAPIRRVDGSVELTSRSMREPPRQLKQISK